MAITLRAQPVLLLEATRTGQDPFIEDYARAMFGDNSPKVKLRITAVWPYVVSLESTNLRNPYFASSLSPTAQRTIHCTM